MATPIEIQVLSLSHPPISSTLSPDKIRMVRPTQYYIVIGSIHGG